MRAGPVSSASAEPSSTRKTSWRRQGEPKTRRTILCVTREVSGLVWLMRNLQEEHKQKNSFLLNPFWERKDNVSKIDIFTISFVFRKFPTHYPLLRLSEKTQIFLTFLPTPPHTSPVLTTHLSHTTGISSKITVRSISVFEIVGY